MLKVIQGLLRRSGVNLEKKYTTEKRLGRTSTGYLELVTDNSIGESFLLSKSAQTKPENTAGDLEQQAI